ncbi:hypothetical protein S83_036037 [Arachis hypogaea]
MMGVGAMREDTKAMILSGFTSLVAGVCSIAISEFVFVHLGLDIEIAQIKRQEEEEEDEIEKKSLPNPLQIAAASSFTFSAGAIVPLLVVFFVRNYKFRLELILESDSFVLILFGYLVRLFHLGLMLEPSLVNG